MNKTIFFLAQRIMFSTAYKKGISPITAICFIGIFIGSFSLSLVTAIMNGFEIDIYKKMQGIHSHIIIDAHGQEIDFEAITKVLRTEFPSIEGISPTTTRHILIRSPHTDIPVVTLIKGIDPIAETKTSILAKKIVQHLPGQKFSHLFTHNQIIIGKQFAHDHNLILGDTIELLFTQEEHAKGNKITFDTHKTIISGIFSTGIDEFDRSVIYSSLNFLEKLFPNTSIEEAHISLKQNTDETSLIQSLKKRLGLNVFSWKSLYPALVATLTLEKYVSFFILALVLLVASMNIISLIFMLITQKQTDLALLKSMGMRHTEISSIFFIISMTISCTASICGLFTAWLASWFLNRYPFIQLPDTYYTTQLPVAMNWHIIIAVFFVVFIFSCIATWIPTRRIKHINISQVLRFEK